MGTTEDEMVGWHHQLNGHEFEQALGDGEGQGGLACCSPWGRKESDMTERLKNNEKPRASDEMRVCLSCVCASITPPASLCFLSYLFRCRGLAKHVDPEVPPSRGFQILLPISGGDLKISC